MSNTEVPVRRIALLAAVLCVVALVRLPAQAPSGAPRVLTAADYARAERSMQTRTPGFGALRPLLYGVAAILLVVILALAQAVLVPLVLAAMAGCAALGSRLGFRLRFRLGLGLRLRGARGGALAAAAAAASSPSALLRSWGVGCARLGGRGGYGLSRGSGRARVGGALVG